MKTIACLALVMAVGCGGVAASDPRDGAAGAGSSGGQVGATAGAGGGGEGGTNWAEVDGSSAGAAGTSVDAWADMGTSQGGAGGGAGSVAGMAGADPMGGSGGAGASGGSAEAGVADAGLSIPPCLVIQKTIDGMAFKLCKDAQGHNLGTPTFYCAVCDPTQLQPPQGSSICQEGYLCVSDCSIGFKNGPICTVQP